MQTRNLFTQAHVLLVYHNLHGDPFFVKKVKRWCSSALEREYLKTHSRDIMPVYSPTDKQVNENPDERCTENLFLLSDSLKCVCSLSPDPSMGRFTHSKACFSD